MKQEIKKFTITCPACGNQLFKAQGSSDMEITCGKCKRKYSVWINQGMICVEQITDEPDHKALLVARARAYAEMIGYSLQAADSATLHG